MIVLIVIGLAAVPAWAAELRLTGFIDNVFPHVESNFSSQDNDTTRNGDQATYGRTRGRMFFNMIASDDLRGVVGFEMDQAWGAPSTDKIGSCNEGEGTFAFSECGFDRAIDNINIELKHLYVDFRVPQLPIGNRWRLGGFRFQALPLHSSLVYNIDGGGGDVKFDFTDQVALLLSYQQFEEDLDRFTGSPQIGEDYVVGSTLMLKPIPNLDFHLIGLFGHFAAPFSSTGTGSPFVGIAQDARNVDTEDRYYLGVDARWRIGNTRIEPTFVYLLGTRKFTGASAAATGVNEADFSGYMAYLVVQHTMGPWLFAGKFAYKSGNEAGDDLNNRGVGNKEDIGFRQIATESDRFGDWFEIFGTSEVDSTGSQQYRRGGETGSFDRFGWVALGGKVEYQATDKLVLEGAAGGFWTAEKTGCPANFRTGATPETCTGPNSPSTSSGEPALNFTGDSKFMGWEIDAGLRYTIMPGLTWTPRAGFADYGAAYDLNNRSAKQAWSLFNRLIYIF
jgi:hypothetical protein